MGRVELEDYVCEGCRASGLDGMDCGCCPSNSDRIAEWRRKHGRTGASGSYHNSSISGLFTVEP